MAETKQPSIGKMMDGECYVGNQAMRYSKGATLKEIRMENEIEQAPARLTLSEKSIVVMQMIAQGHSYDQIVSSHPGLTYRDIFDAAAEVMTASRASKPSHMAQLKSRHRRAYQAWTPQEEEQLRQLINNGQTVARIAGVLERNRGAIRARIVRLELVSQLQPKEQDRLYRAMKQEELDKSEGNQSVQNE